MRRPLWLAGIVLLVGACAPGATNEPQTTVPTAPPTTATTAAIDPFAVPAVIDAGYVNRVLAALDRVEGDLVRSLVERNVIDATARTRLRAIYNDPQFEEEFTSLVKLFGSGTTEFKRPPGDRHTTVTEIVAASRSCVLAKVARDYSEVVNTPRPPEPDKVRIVTLKPTQASSDPTGLNPTPWSVTNAEVLRIDQPVPQEALCVGF